MEPMENTVIPDMENNEFEFHYSNSVAPGIIFFSKECFRPVSRTCCWLQK